MYLANSLKMMENANFPLVLTDNFAVSRFFKYFILDDFQFEEKNSVLFLVLVARLLKISLTKIITCHRLSL